MGDEKEDEGEIMYEVEDLLEHRVKDGKDFYLVKWKGFDEDTWEPDCNIGEELDDLKKSIRRKSAAGVADSAEGGDDDRSVDAKESKKKKKKDADEKKTKKEKKKKDEKKKKRK